MLPDSSLRAVRAGTLHIGVYASPAYLAQQGTPASWEDVSRHEVISSLALSSKPESWRVERGGRATHVEVRPRLVVNTTDAAAEAAAAGLGLVRLVSYQAEPLVRSGALVAVTLPDTRTLPIHLVQPAGTQTAARIRLFVSEIATGLRRLFPAE